MSETVRVGVNGYGVIGKRVADATKMQPDMELVGVSDVVSDYRIKTAVALGIPVYASMEEKSSALVAAGVPVAGALHQLLGREGGTTAGGRNLSHYREQGGQGHIPGRG